MNSIRLYRGQTLYFANGDIGKIESISKEVRPGRTNRTTMVTYSVNEVSMTSTKRGLLARLTYGNKPLPAPEAAPAPVVAADVVREEVAGAVRSGSLAELIAQEIGPYVKSGVDAAEVKRLVDDRIVEALLPRRIECVVPGTGEYVNVGVQHAYFEALRRMAEQRINVWIVGPAGSGKTSIAGAVARSLGLPFYSAPVCMQTSEGKLVGYMTAGNGSYVKTHLREAYENGGVFLLDECDAGNPGIMLVMNSLIAQDEYAFADAIVKKHPNFVMLAGANTAGTGASREYNGRNQIDGATLDRFVFLNLPYDPTIEAVMCGLNPSVFAEAERVAPYEFAEIGDKYDADKDAALKAAAENRCVAFVQQFVKVRNAVSSLKVRHIVSPRASSTACKLIRAGFLMKDVWNLAVWKGASEDTVQKIKAEAGIE